MKTNAISMKIKMIGILFIILMSVIIITTIYINNKNKKDALIINIAGKERMLTQKISKSIFYLYHNNQHSFTELDNATVEFIYNLNSLKDGNNLTGISKAPTDEIRNQIAKVEILWNNFHQNIKNFKQTVLIREASNEKALKNVVDAIHNTNNTLLTEVDNLVSMYTLHMESKTDNLKYIQYIFGLLIIALMIYSFNKLKDMEENAKKFFEFSKKVVENPDNQPIQPIQFEAEKEIVEATDTINCFIDKVNSAVEYSTNASVKLEEITEEFDQVLDEINANSEINKQLDKSEDMVIQSQEELINSTKKLQELKDELDKLLTSCKHHA